MSLQLPKEGVPLVVGFGGGVNSMAVLVALREAGMTPDLVIFADTGGEKPGTYDYLNRVSRQERPDRTKHAWPGAWQNTIFRNESSFLMFGGER